MALLRHGQGRRELHLDLHDHVTSFRRLLARGHSLMRVPLCVARSRRPALRQGEFLALNRWYRPGPAGQSLLQVQFDKHAQVGIFSLVQRVRFLRLR